MNLLFTSQNLNDPRSRNQTLDLAVHNDKYRGISVNDVILIHGEGNYTTFHISSGKKLMVAKTLKQSATLLDEQVFVRVHKSYLINLHYVQDYDMNSEEIIVRNGLRVGVARRRRREIEVRVAPYIRRRR